MIHIHYTEPINTNEMQQCIKAKKEYGGEIYLFTTIWSFFAVSKTIYHPVHFTNGASRHQQIAGFCIKTCTQGIWGLSLITDVPLALTINILGGIKVLDCYISEGPKPEVHVKIGNEIRIAKWITYPTTTLLILGLMYFLYTLNDSNPRHF